MMQVAGKILLVVEMLICLLPALIFLTLSPIGITLAFSASIIMGLLYTAMALLGIWGLYALVYLSMNAFTESGKIRENKPNIIRGIIAGTISCLTGIVLGEFELLNFLFFSGPILILLHLLWINRNEIFVT